MTVSLGMMKLFDKHLKRPGYWSWEAAAVTVISRIDDSSYRDKPYYPKDLVDYARIQYTSLDQQGNTMIKELR
jgi:hypothetical protein